jgi:adenylyltransferase/sulfurtransferase
MAASMAATEALKILTGAEERLRRTVISYDIWQNERAEVSAATPRPDCRTCHGRDFVHLRGARKAQITLCGRNSVQIHESRRPIDLAELSRALKPHGTVRYTEFLLKFWREPYEITLFPDGRAIIKGTVDKGLARSLYARYVGI